VTTVTFHFNVANRLDYVRRLARKEQAAGARSVVVADADTLEQLDSDLWLTATTDFLPHCRDMAPPRVRARSPLVLTSGVPSGPAADVLINLSDAIPQGVESFDRVIEVVGLDPQERSAARQRWRQYAAEKLELLQFDAGGRSTTE